MQKPPPWELDQHIRITATAPPGVTSIRATSSHHENGLFAYGPVVESVLNVLKTTIKTSEQEYQVRSSQLPQTIEQELAATRLEGSTHPLPPSEAIIRELGVRNTLLARKTAEFHHQTALANRFYGVDPIGRRWPAFYPKAVTLENPVRPNGIAMQAWLASYKAAYEARLLSQTIQMLNQQQVNVLNWLAAVQAQEQVQREAQYLAAEAARKAQEAQKEAQRLAAETARKAKEAKEAKTQEEAAEKRRAETDAQLKELYALIASMDAASANRPFSVSGSAVAVGPVFSLATGRLATNPATTQAIRASLQTAIAAVIAAGTASASAVMVGFAALLFPSPLGNSEMSIPPLSDLVPDDLHNWSLSLSKYEPDDLHALSVPLSDLLPDGLPELHAIAEANGDIELPVAMGSRTVGNTTEFFVAATHGTTVPSKVPVRLATLDPALNVYRSYNPDVPSIGMTWTPIVQPNNASTSLPASEMNVAVYDGTTVTALEGRIDRFPELDLYSFGGFITVFPADSGMPPVFTMFRDRRNEPGVASGYGEVVSGVWLGVASQGEGAAIPKQIADKLRGKEFSNFRLFRENLWRAITDDIDLAKQFRPNNIEAMKKGHAPSSREEDHLGSNIKFELHHIEPVSEGGAIYDIDNIRVITPRRHSEIHKKGRLQ